MEHSKSTEAREFGHHERRSCVENEMLAAHVRKADNECENCLMSVRNVRTFSITARQASARELQSAIVRY